MPGEQGSLLAVQGNYKSKQTQYDFYIKQYGLDKPPLQRFQEYIVDMLTFHFGNSFRTNSPVLDEMISSGRLVNTLVLLGSSTILSIVIGIVLGVIASRRRGSTVDSVSVTSSLITFSLPTFWIGITFIYIFSYSLGWFPPGGVEPGVWSSTGVPPLFTKLFVRLQYLMLPMLVLTLIAYGGFLLLTRATMIDALSEDYILTAKAKGLSERTVLFHHAFKNASLPLVTASALAFGSILGGAILTETIFNYNGIGLWLFNSIGFKDFPVMQAMFYILALSVIIANFASDLVYGIIDPRIKYE
ncbi:MAG TPA: ABC transporter permease [Candidatus Bathyarchaeia archaeon]|nr:ABC transporter permease [Candidatus Bathyarchaeia archaeon]